MIDGRGWVSSNGRTWFSSAGRLCAAFMLFVLLIGIGRALAQTCTVHTGDPTEPPTGTISLASPSVDFDSKLPPPAGAATGPADCLGPNCSRFELTVSGATPGKIVRVRIDWLLNTNDYDLYIFDPLCQQVGNSGNGLTTFEEAVFTPAANTTYEVVIIHFAAVGDQIDGRAFLDDAPVVKKPNWIGPNGTGITFSPNGVRITPAGEAPTGKGTTFAPAAFSDGEPSARSDVRGNQYPAGIRGVPAGVDVWRFGPDAFCPQFTFHTVAEFPSGDPVDGYVWLGQPDGIFPDPADPPVGSPDAGGGDIELAVSFPSDATSTPQLSMVSLTLANITAATSFNRGNTWVPDPANAFAAVAPPADRQWIEAYGTTTVYLYYRTLATLTGLVIQKSTVPTTGITYTSGATLVNPLGYTPGWIDVDQTANPDGSVDIYLSAQNSTEGVVFHCVDPNPTLPQAVTCDPASTVEKSMSHGHIFDVVSVGNDDAVYYVWSNNVDVFYAFSTNKGQTWSGPVRITGGAGWSGPNTNIFPWITAGSANRIGIVWYGTSALSSGDNNAEWKVYYAFTDNARGNTPKVRWLPASDHIIHKSNVSQAGFSPGDTAVNRNLIDFFEVAHDPRNGAAVIAFADDHNDFDGHTYWTRQIAGPSLIGGGIGPINCKKLQPFIDPEVIDFSGDANGVSGVAGPSQPDVDILNIDYDWEMAGSDLYLTADITINTLLALTPQRSYRAYFAVNTVKGLMDAGNQYYIEMATQTGTPQFRLGVADRRDDGTMATAQVEVIDADQAGPAFTPGMPGQVHIRVNVNRLDYSYVADGVPNNGGSSAPGVGHLVIGLLGEARLHSVATSVLDATRGGSFIVLNRQGDGTSPLNEVECNDPRVITVGCWVVDRTKAGELYCWTSSTMNDPSDPYKELSFAGTTTQVRFDFFKGPRGGFVEVIIDGVSREIINQFAPANSASPHDPLTADNRTYIVPVQVNPHVIRVVHRRDLEQPGKDMAFVDGFVVVGALSTSSSTNQQIVVPTVVLPSGASTTHKIVAGPTTRSVAAVVQPVSEELFANGLLVIEIRNPAGQLIARSKSSAVPPLAVGGATLVPGEYTVRIRNTTTRAINYKAVMIRALQ